MAIWPYNKPPQTPGDIMDAAEQFRILRDWEKAQDKIMFRDKEVLANPVPSLNDMIGFRMRWHGPTPFRHLNAVRDNETVFVFIIHDGKSVTLEDAYDMFPSDALITKLRLLL